MDNLASFMSCFNENINQNRQINLTFHLFLHNQLNNIAKKLIIFALKIIKYLKYINILIICYK
jgi:hypothetical protein